MHALRVDRLVDSTELACVPDAVRHQRVEDGRERA
jgi:hypothetical protein